MRQTRDLHEEVREWFGAFAAREGIEPELTMISGRMVTAMVRSCSRASSAKALGRTLARRGYDIAVLQRCYRTLQRICWAEIMTSACREISDPPLLAAALEFQWDHLSRTVSWATERAESSFVAEVERHASTAQARRRGIVESILREERVDAERATTQLGHNLHIQQTGVVLWAPDGGSDAASPLESLAGAIARTVGAPAPLTLAAGGRLLWMWLATPHPPDLSTVSRIGALQGPEPTVRVALGVPTPGVDGFRTSHREALRAYRIAIAGAGSAATLYRDVELINLPRGGRVCARPVRAPRVG